MASDNFTSIPADNSTDLTRESLVTALYQAPANAQNGTKTQPGIAFFNDQTSGIYLYPDASAIGFVSHGTEVITASTTGVTFQIPVQGLVAAKEVSTEVKAPGASFSVSFDAFGDHTYVITPNMALNLSLNTQSANVGQRQVVSILLKQPTTGGFPVTISMPGVRFPKNAAGVPTPPVVSTNAGDFTPITLVSWGDSVLTITEG